MVGNGGKWWEMVGNGGKWWEMVGNGGKWCEMEKLPCIATLFSGKTFRLTLQGCSS